MKNICSVREANVVQSHTYPDSIITKYSKRLNGWSCGVIGNTLGRISGDPGSSPGGTTFNPFPLVYAWVHTICGSER